MFTFHLKKLLNNLNFLEDLLEILVEKKMTTSKLLELYNSQ